MTLPPEKEATAAREVGRLLKAEAEFYDTMSELAFDAELSAELKAWSNKLQKYSERVDQKEDRAILTTMSLAFAMGQKGVSQAFKVMLSGTGGDKTP